MLAFQAVDQSSTRAVARLRIHIENPALHPGVMPRRLLSRGHTEVLWVVAKEHTQKARAISTDATSRHNSAECDWPPVRRFESEQSWPVPSRVCSGEVSNSQTVDPDRDGVRVVRIVCLGHQHRDDFDSDPVPSVTRDDLTQGILVERLPDYLESDVALENLDTGAAGPQSATFCHPIHATRVDSPGPSLEGTVESAPA